MFYVVFVSLVTSPVVDRFHPLFFASCIPFVPPFDNVGPALASLPPPGRPGVRTNVAGAARV